MTLDALLDAFILIKTPAQAHVWLTTMIVAGLACWRGDRPERIAVPLVLLNWVVTGLVDQIFWRGETWGVVLIDGLLFAGLYFLALRYPRWWIHGAAAFALLTFLSHFAAMLDSSIVRWANVTLRYVTSYGLLLALAAGAIEAPWARRYEAWRSRVLA
ncbi:hypothetical protein [uncultured Brevundimonas sp.]|uniref:hypothetical protein n=1 Tax=uncultured Brevundimonas sp. TaxID=213418 RepID=UPI0030EEEDC9|tara:strand:+ start:88958 stop:89431 length:474 start_codon:yes stop_codon:yes gene_type:complete